MRTRVTTPAALLLFSLPWMAFAFPDYEESGSHAAAYQEKGPRSLAAYRAAGEIPTFLRIDVRGYNIRKTPDFRTKYQGNIDFQTTGPATYVVNDVQWQHYGAALQIVVDDELRWVYVPYDRKNDFQFCESEACFTAMERSLDYLLRNSRVSAADAAACGISAGPEGLVLPAGAPAPHREPNVLGDAMATVPPPTPAVSNGDLQYRPNWERRSSAARGWTASLQASMEKYGQGLANTRRLGDAERFCPNYSSLSLPQRKEFWVHMMAAIALPESTDTLISRPFDERRKQNVSARTTMDGYGFEHYSVGLFALSYNYGTEPLYQPFCGGISRSADRGKGVLDPSLTLNSVKVQTDCAVGIMNRYVTHHGSIGYDGNAFRGPAWSTVMHGNPATRALTIPEVRQSFPPCFAGSGSAPARKGRR